MSKSEIKHFAGLTFIACMFIGAGLGLLFGRPDVGGAIGMGVGFLFMGLIRVREVKLTPVTLSLPRNLTSLTLTIIGFIIILAGVGLIFRPEWVYPYLAGMAVTAVGLAILLAGLLSFKKA